MDYPIKTQPPPPQRHPTAFDKWRDDRLAWVNSDCKNKLCIDGGVSIDDGQYSTYYRCPICSRSQVAAPEWTGEIEYWTDEELSMRLKDRKDVYFDKNYRYKRGLEVVALLKSIAGGPARQPPKEEDSWESGSDPF